MISREKFEKAVDKVWSGCTRVGLWDKCHDTQRKLMRATVGEAFEVAGIKVEDPPILPEVTPGKWGYREMKSAKTAFMVTVDGKGGIAYHLTEADAKVMAGSNELVEKVIELHEAFTVRESRQAKMDMLDILEGMGCNVDRFR